MYDNSHHSNRKQTTAIFIAVLFLHILVGFGLATMDLVQIKLPKSTPIQIELLTLSENQQPTIAPLEQNPEQSVSEPKPTPAPIKPEPIKPTPPKPVEPPVKQPSKPIEQKPTPVVEKKPTAQKVINKPIEQDSLLQSQKQAVFQAQEQARLQQEQQLKEQQKQERLQQEQERQAQQKQAQLQQEQQRLLEEQLKAEQLKQAQEAKAEAERQQKMRAEAEAERQRQAQIAQQAAAQKQAQAAAQKSKEPISLSNSQVMASWLNKPKLDFGADEIFELGEPRKKSVNASFDFDAKGNVSNITIETTGSAKLDRELKKRLAKARLHPQVIDGVARAGRANFIISF